MQWRSATAMAFSIVLAGIQPASAQLCKERCYAWCDQNRPTGSCRSDCAARAACGQRLNKKQCMQWCDQNKPADAACTADCAWRR